MNSSHASLQALGAAPGQLRTDTQ